MIHTSEDFTPVTQIGFEMTFNPLLYEEQSSVLLFL